MVHAPDNACLSMVDVWLSMNGAWHAHADIILGAIHVEHIDCYFLLGDLRPTLPPPK